MGDWTPLSAALAVFGFFGTFISILGAFAMIYFNRGKKFVDGAAYWRTEAETLRVAYDQAKVDCAARQSELGKCEDRVDRLSRRLAGIENSNDESP